MEKIIPGEGGFVFISHSHQDIEKVRKIRNELEQNGFEPLCFYLKCLSDADEIEDLIRREIDAREWFIYADSPNARASKWVKKEREYIASQPSRQVITIDLESEEASAVSGVLSRALRVLLVHQHAGKLAEQLKAMLLKKDYQVYSANCSELVYDKTQLQQFGCVVLVMSSEKSGEGEMTEIRTLAGQCGVSVMTVDENTDLQKFIRELSGVEKEQIREALEQCTSHQEAEALLMTHPKDKEIETMVYETYDRLDEEDRVEDDLYEAFQRGLLRPGKEMFERIYRMDHPKALPSEIRSAWNEFNSEK